MTDQLTRYLTWQGSVHPGPLTNRNCIRQGCSLSILAINGIMAAWSLVVQQVPGVRPFAFIDDTYLITQKAPDLEQLPVACQVSQLADAVLGQISNPAKCGWWVSDDRHAPPLALSFEGMPRLQVLRPLGVTIHLNQRGTPGLRDSALDRFRDAMPAIDTLPVPPKVKARYASLTPRSSTLSRGGCWTPCALELPKPCGANGHIGVIVISSVPLCIRLISSILFLCWPSGSSPMWLPPCNRSRSCLSYGLWRSPMSAALVPLSLPILSKRAVSLVSVSRPLMLCLSSRACPFPSSTPLAGSLFVCSGGLPPCRLTALRVPLIGRTLCAAPLGSWMSI